MRIGLKRYMTLFMAVLMVTVIIGGCGSSSGDSQSTGGNKSSQEKEAPKEIEIVLMNAGAGNSRDVELIQNEINKYVLDKINVTVKLSVVALSNYAQQMTLMLSGGEPLDLMVVMGNQIAPYASRNQIIPLDELLNKYGNGINEALGSFAKTGSIDGKIYAVPTLRDLSTGFGLIMRKDLLEKYNINSEDLKSLQDMTPVFDKIKKGEGKDFYPLIPNMPTVTFMDKYITVDRLDDGNGVLLDYGSKDTKVVFYEETEEYKQLAGLFHEWYKSGYILKDIATSQENYGSLMRAGQGFAYFNNIKPGILLSAKNNTGYDCVNLQFIDYFATTTQVNSISWGIAQNSKSPEAAMKFLNLMYSDPKVVTLLTWGVEGTHYVYTDDKKHVKYPDGIDAKTSGWSLTAGWEMGNQFLTPVWENDAEDLWQQQKAANDNAKKSMALGFAFDSTKVKNEITAITNIRNQYKPLIENGVVDPSSGILQEYIGKLKSAGMDKVIAEKQSQLNAWLAAK